MVSLGSLPGVHCHPWHHQPGTQSCHIRSSSGACWELGGSRFQEPPTSKGSSGNLKHSQLLVQGSTPTVNQYRMEKGSFLSLETSLSPDSAA